MNRLLFAAAVLLTALVLVPAGAVAASPTQVTGGGTGTFDGVNPGSQFGLGIVFGGSSARGHFNCVMAGRSAVFGLHLMKVDGQVSSGSADAAAGTAEFSGVGTLHVNGQKFTNTFHVTVLAAGGPGVGKFQLTVVGPPFGVFEFPPETVATGRIEVH